LHIICFVFFIGSEKERGFYVFSSKKAGLGQTYPVVPSGHFFASINLLTGL